MINEVFNMDCIEGMKKYPDKHFSLAIVDPPYFTGPETRRFYGCEVNKLNIRRKDYKIIPKWDIPGEEYYNELQRVSTNQIICGINYFEFTNVPVGRIIWDKVNGSSSFSDCEIASISSIKSTRIFRFMWNGMMQGKSLAEGHVAQGNKQLNEHRIHPTQKPIILYKWLLHNYAIKGDRILDTHLGSGSSRIAAHELGFDFTGFELDSDYYQAQEKRFKEHSIKLQLF